MKNIEIIYCPIGVPTFHLESAQKAFEDSVNLLKSIYEHVTVPNQMLLSVQALNDFLKDKHPDLVIIQNVTFANAAYATDIFKAFDTEFVLWTLREPVIDGGRLRLNSLTGALSAGNAFYQLFDKELFYLFGSPQEEKIKNRLRQIIKAVLVRSDMKGMNLLTIGDTPQGFGFGRALDSEMARYFGVNLLSIEARELMQIARKLKDDEYQSAQKQADAKTVGLDETPSKNREDFYRLYHAYRQYIIDHNVKAIASRCWPDFFTEYGTPVCAVLSMLNDELIAAACEADAYGALSMYIGQKLTDQPTYIGDPVSIDESENTMTFWHCGAGACSLARTDTGPLTGVHPNRKIGPTMEFGLKPSAKATIFRIGRKPDGTFRFFLLKGEILDKPKQFSGTSAVVKVKPEVTQLVSQMVHDGWEPHFILLYEDVVEELIILAKMLGMEVCEY